MKKYYCIKQHDITDCGAACLATICKQNGYKSKRSKKELKNEMFLYKAIRYHRLRPACLATICKQNGYKILVLLFHGCSMIVFQLVGGMKRLTENM